MPNYKTFKEQFDRALTDEKRMMLIAKLYSMALHGNLQAFKLILQIMGEYPIGKKDTGEAGQVEYILHWGTGENDPGSKDELPQY